MKILREYLNITNLYGKNKLENISIDLLKNKIEIYAKTADSVVGVFTQLNCNPFNIENKSIGILGVDKFSKYIDIIGKEIQFKVKENELILNGNNKTISYLIKLSDFINTNLNKEERTNFQKYVSEIKTGQKITINAQSLKIIQDYFKLVNTDRVTMTLSTGKLQIEVSEKNTDKIVENIVVDIFLDKDIIIKLREPFINAIYNLNGDIVLYFRENSPMLVEYNADNGILGLFLIGQVV